MSDIVNFFSLIFWALILIFLVSSFNFLKILFIAEILWGTIYVMCCYLGVCTDDLNLISLTFFLLAIAGIEFSIGFLLIILFKNFKQTISLDDESKATPKYSYKTIKKINSFKLI